MWFKHLHLYRLHDAPELSSDELASALQEHAAKPLGNATHAAWAGLHLLGVWAQGSLFTKFNHIGCFQRCVKSAYCPPLL